VPCAEEQFIELGELPATEVPELLPVQPVHPWSQPAQHLPPFPGALATIWAPTISDRTPRAPAAPTIRSALYCASESPNSLNSWANSPTRPAWVRTMFR